MDILPNSSVDSSGRKQNCFKIQNAVTFGSTIFFQNADRELFRFEYPTPRTLDSFTVRIRDEYGNQLDNLGLDWSFSLWVQ